MKTETGAAESAPTSMIQAIALRGCRSAISRPTIAGARETNPDGYAHLVLSDMLGARPSTTPAKIAHVVRATAQAVIRRLRMGTSFAFRCDFAIGASTEPRSGAAPMRRALRRRSVVASFLAPREHSERSGRCPPRAMPARPVRAGFFLSAE